MFVFLPQEKLILSYEQEILRLYGNATRSAINQEIPFSYCLLLKDNEVYNNPAIQERSSALINDEYSNGEGNKRTRTRWNGRSFLKWLDESNIKYKRLSVSSLQPKILRTILLRHRISV